jgi:hypothetical protein
MAPQGQKVDAARGQPLLPCTLHERSLVEVVAGLLALDLLLLPTKISARNARRLSG